MTDRENESVQATLSFDDTNTIHETYVNALHHGNEAIPADAWRVGVVNYKMYGLDSVTATNFESLGPPENLFTAFKEKRSELEDDGVEKTEAHNAAWDAVKFEEVYRSYLESEWENPDSSVREACNQILSELSDRPVAIVCYEGTKKNCHRHILKSFLNEKNNSESTPRSTEQ